MASEIDDDLLRVGIMMLLQFFRVSNNVFCKTGSSILSACFLSLNDSENPLASARNSESTTLADEEVEIKLPCRSVSINVVGMPSDNDEVNARPSPCNNDFQGRTNFEL